MSQDTNDTGSEDPAGVNAFLVQFYANRSRNLELGYAFPGPEYASSQQQLQQQQLQQQQLQQQQQQQQWQQTAHPASSSGVAWPTTTTTTTTSAEETMIAAETATVATRSTMTATVTTPRSVFSEARQQSIATSRSSAPSRAPPGPAFAQFVATGPWPSSQSAGSTRSLPSRPASSSARSGFDGTASSHVSTMSAGVNPDEEEKEEAAAAATRGSDMRLDNNNNNNNNNQQFYYYGRGPAMESINEEDAESSSYPQSNYDHHHHLYQSRAPPPLLWCEYHRVLGCGSVFHPLDLQGWTAHHAAHMAWQYPARLACWFCMASFGGGDEAMLAQRMLHLHGHIMVGGRPDAGSGSGSGGCAQADASVDANALNHLRGIHAIDDGAWRTAIHSDLPGNLRVPTDLVEDLPDDRRRLLEQEQERERGRGGVGGVEEGSRALYPTSGRQTGIPYDLNWEKREQRKKGGKR